MEFYIFTSFNKSKKQGKDQESIQSSTTPDPGYQWENDNFTIRLNKRGPRAQPLNICNCFFSTYILSLSFIRHTMLIFVILISFPIGLFKFLFR